MATSFQVYELVIISSFTLLIISLPCLSIDTNINTTNPKHPRLEIELIHRDSPLSPLYNPQTTFWDRAEKSYEISIARYDYLTSKRRDRYRADTIPFDFSFLAKLKVGTPPVDVFVLIDTGCDFLWIQCNPCIHCYPQTNPIYDRTKSITFANVECNSIYCKSDQTTYCDKDLCSYKTAYYDKSFSEGILGREFILFSNSNNGIKTTIRDSNNGIKAALRDVVIGCGLNNSLSENHQGGIGGVLGLAANNLSLVAQLTPSNVKPRFSVCMGNASDPSSKGNLIIGEDAHIAGFTTPFTLSEHYRVQVVDIQMGSQSLDLPPSEYGLHDGSVILDTGTVYSFIPRIAFDMLAVVIHRLLERFNTPWFPTDEPSDITCFKGSIGKDLNGFPTMTISFKGHAKLVLEEWSIFIQKRESVFCLAFAYTGGRYEPSVIGSFAQQFYNFGFDFAAKQLSIIHSECIQ